MNRAKVLLSYMNMAEFDKTSKHARHDMKSAWTTGGLKEAMAELFAGILSSMEKATQHAQDIRAAVEQSYRRFHSEYGLPKLEPAAFSLAPYFEQLTQLEAEAEAFRKSPAMTVTEQHFVIRKFFITMVSRARQLTSDGNTAARNWFQSIMTPVSQQIQEHKAAMDRRIDNLRKVQENLDGLSAKITELEAAKKDLETQRDRIRGLFQRLRRPQS